MQIIPAIDLIDGKCVRLIQGDYHRQTIYDYDPLEMAKKYADWGITRLHLVDLDAARTGELQHLQVLERLASKTDLHIDWGGGVKSAATVLSLLNAGARQITAGSIAVSDPQRVRDWLEEFGGEKIILGADTMSGKVAIDAWQKQSDMSINTLIEKFLAHSLRYIISTDVSRDGTGSGPALDLYERLGKAFPQLALIASGCVAYKNHLAKLAALNLYGVIIGKALLDGRLKRADLEPFLC
jgi:phosphoribosylformimino-5-aminoimidazole carboxamide ribotide isomerase